jgi:cob(I)alamin adenosyltransferase
MYVRVHIDTGDVLEEVSTEDLQEEISRRRRNKTGGHLADFIIPAGSAAEALEQAATELRRAGRHDLAFKLDEARCDYIEPHFNRTPNYRFKAEPQKLNS